LQVHPCRHRWWPQWCRLPTFVPCLLTFKIGCWDEKTPNVPPSMSGISNSRSGAIRTLVSSLIGKCLPMLLMVATFSTWNLGFSCPWCSTRVHEFDSTKLQTVLTKDERPFSFEHINELSYWLCDHLRLVATVVKCRTNGKERTRLTPRSTKKYLSSWCPAHGTFHFSKLCLGKQTHMAARHWTFCEVPMTGWSSLQTMSFGRWQLRILLFCIKCLWMNLTYWFCFCPAQVSGLTSRPLIEEYRSARMST
jgi:hypothetical protein